MSEPSPVVHDAHFIASLLTDVIRTRPQQRPELPDCAGSELVEAVFLINEALRALRYLDFTSAAVFAEAALELEPRPDSSPETRLWLRVAQTRATLTLRDFVRTRAMLEALWPDIPTEGGLGFCLMHAAVLLEAASRGMPATPREIREGRDFLMRRLTMPREAWGRESLIELMVQYAPHASAFVLHHDRGGLNDLRLKVAERKVRYVREDLFPCDSLRLASPVEAARAERHRRAQTKAGHPPVVIMKRLEHLLSIEEAT